MTPPKFIIYLTCLLLWKLAKTDYSKQPAMVHQGGGFISAAIGDSLKLNCFSNKEAIKIFWYKQKLGEKPQLICNSYKYGKNVCFENELQTGSRFTVYYKDDESILNISSVQVSDTGTYFCARSISFIYEFGEATVVSVRSLTGEAPLRVETIQSEGFDTLNCTVETGSCDEEHSVYWFRNSEELFYTQGSNNSHCERKPSTQALTCVYNLPIKNLNRSHAGTYYCAVASCGDILFGNGTRLNFHGENSLGVVYFLSGALAVTIVVLTVLLYKLIKRSGCQLTECQARFSSPSVGDAEISQGVENLQYAALNVNRSYTQKRQTANSNSECIYSRVK